MNAVFVSLTFAVPRVLLIIGLVIGLVFAIVRRTALGRATAFAIAGIALLIVTSVLDIALSYALPFVPGDRDNVLLFLAARNAFSSLLWGAGLALVIVAVFIGRGGAGVTPGPGRTFPPGGPLP